MELVDVVKKRRSIRLYTGEPLQKDVIDDLIEAAILAPSSMNVQPWHFHVAMGEIRQDVGELVAMTTRFLEEYADLMPPEKLDRVAQFYANLGNAPVVIAVSVPVGATEVDTTNILLSVGAAIENLMLRATDLGLGCCSITAPHWIVDRLKEAFQVPPERSIASLVLVGRPAEEPSPPERRHDVVTYLE